MEERETLQKKKDKKKKKKRKCWKMGKKFKELMSGGK